MRNRESENEQLPVSNDINDDVWSQRDNEASVGDHISSSKNLAKENKLSDSSIS